MITIYRSFRWCLLSCAALITVNTFADSDRDKDSKNILFGGSGLVETHDYSGEIPSQLSSWCQGMCFPNFKVILRDATKENRLGVAYVWMKNITVVGATFCAEIFDIVKMDDDDSMIYTHSNPLGVCGAPLDGSVHPIAHTSPGLVYSFANDGVIVGGTKKYENATGTYTDRFIAELPYSVLLGQAPSAGNEYIDNFFWKLSISK